MHKYVRPNQSCAAKIAYHCALCPGLAQRDYVARQSSALICFHSFWIGVCLHQQSSPDLPDLQSVHRGAHGCLTTPYAWSVSYCNLCICAHIAVIPILLWQSMTSCSTVHQVLLPLYTTIRSQASGVFTIKIFSTQDL